MRRYDRYLRVIPPPMYVVRRPNLSPAQLFELRPGKVVVCRDPSDLQAIEVLPDHDLTGCVAGWISDEDIE